MPLPGLFFFSSFSCTRPFSTSSPIIFSTFPPLIAYLSPPLAHTHPHTLVDTLQLRYTEWKECQMNRGGPLLVSHGCRRGSWLNLHKVWRVFFPRAPSEFFYSTSRLESETNVPLLLVIQFDWWLRGNSVGLESFGNIKTNPVALLKVKCAKELWNMAFILMTHKVMLIFFFQI